MIDHNVQIDGKTFPIDDNYGNLYPEKYAEKISEAYDVRNG